MEDLISNNFVDNVNRTIIKRTLRLSQVVLVITVVYSLLELTNWYIAIKRISGGALSSNALYFSYRILPVVAFILLAMGVISWLYCVKANKFINLSFEKNDADLFNRGYNLFYRSAWLILTSFCIAIISATIRLLLN